MTIHEDTWDDGWDDDEEEEDEDEEEEEEEDEEEIEDELAGDWAGDAGLGRIPRAWTRLETVAQVHEHLLDVVGPERDGPRTLWVQFIDEANRALPLIMPISDLPTIVSRELVANLATVVRTAIASNVPHGSVAIALVRRGGGDRGTFEVGWSRALTEEMSKAAVPVRAIVAIGPSRSRVLAGIGT